MWSVECRVKGGQTEKAIVYENNSYKNLKKEVKLIVWSGLFEVIHG